MASILDDATREAYITDAMEAQASRRDHMRGAMARQTDGANFDNRTLNAFITNQMSQSNDPALFALVNSGIRVPTTIDHPSIPVFNPGNMAGAKPAGG